MISQCAQISPNLGFQFCRLVVIELPLILGRDHFLPLLWVMSEGEIFLLPVLLKIYCRLFFANQKLDSAESEIDGIVMQNKGIKQRGVMALFAEGAVVNGKWADTSPCSNHLSARPKTIQLFLTPDPLSNRLCILEIYIVLSLLQPVTVNQSNTVPTAL